MPATFRTDSGIFGDIQANNMIVTGEIKVGEAQQPINQYITQEINTTVGGGIDYSVEINTLSGNIDSVSGDLITLSGVVDGLNVGGGADSTDISGSLNIVSGKVDAISGDLFIANNTLNTATGNINIISGEVENILVARVAEDEQFNLLSERVNIATGNIDTISGAVEGILNAEAADDTAFNTVSGRVDSISGDLNTLSSTVDTATGDISEISGVVQNLSANSTTYGDTDVANYLGGNLDSHIIPDTNSTYDIGSAEYKIRHLYLSDNSLYIGGIEGEKGTQISATPEGAVVFPSGINITGNIDATGANINFGTIGDTPPSVENNVLQWNQVEQKWTAGDGLTNVSNILNTTTGDLYAFYKKENTNIANVSANLTALNFQPTAIPTGTISEGAKGQITYDEDYIYLCVADNTWKRLPSADF